MPFAHWLSSNRFPTQSSKYLLCFTRTPNSNSNRIGILPPALNIYKLLQSFVLLICIIHPHCPIQVSSSVSSRQWSSRVVTTKLGLVRGFIFVPHGYEGVEIFMGLPYASPPLGSLRFMPPVSGSPWPGVKMNPVEPHVCPQVSPLQLYNETDMLREMPKGRLQYLRRLEPMLRNQSEDCLYLNIYVPLTGKTDHFLLFIHHSFGACWS